MKQLTACDRMLESFVEIMETIDVNDDGVWRDFVYRLVLQSHVLHDLASFLKESSIEHAAFTGEGYSVRYASRVLGTFHGRRFALEPVITFFDEPANG